MHGTNDPQVSFTIRTPEQVVPADHPIRAIKPIGDAALRELDPVFDEMYSDVGRPSIPLENLLKACLLMAFYSVRSERPFCPRGPQDADRRRATRGLSRSATLAAAAASRGDRGRQPG